MYVVHDTGASNVGAVQGNLWAHVVKRRDTASFAVLPAGKSWACMHAITPTSMD